MTKPASNAEWLSGLHKEFGDPIFTGKLSDLRSGSSILNDMFCATTDTRDIFRIKNGRWVLLRMDDPERREKFRQWFEVLRRRHLHESIVFDLFSQRPEPMLNTVFAAIDTGHAYIPGDGGSRWARYELGDLDVIGAAIEIKPAADMNSETNDEWAKRTIDRLGREGATERIFHGLKVNLTPVSHSHLVDGDHYLASDTREIWRFDLAGRMWKLVQSDAPEKIEEKPVNPPTKEEIRRLYELTHQSPETEVSYFAYKSLPTPQWLDLLEKSFGRRVPAVPVGGEPKEGDLAAIPGTKSVHRYNGKTWEIVSDHEVYSPIAVREAMESYAKLPEKSMNSDKIEVDNELSWIAQILYEHRYRSVIVAPDFGHQPPPAKCARGTIFVDVAGKSVWFLDSDYWKKIERHNFGDFVNKETAVNQENKTSTKILETVKDDASSAAVRIGAKQFVRLARDPLVAILMRNLGTEDETVRARIATFLDSSAGEAVLGMFLSMALLVAPSAAGPIPGLIAQELRVSSLTNAGDMLAEVVMGPLRELIKSGILGDAIKAVPMPELNDGFRVSEATGIRDKAAVER